MTHAGASRRSSSWNWRLQKREEKEFLRRRRFVSTEKEIFWPAKSTCPSSIVRSPNKIFPNGVSIVETRSTSSAFEEPRTNLRSKRSEFLVDTASDLFSEPDRRFAVLFFWRIRTRSVLGRLRRTSIRTDLPLLRRCCRRCNVVRRSVADARKQENKVSRDWDGLPGRG